MITRDVLVNQLLDDRRDGMNFSAICPEVLLKKVVKPDFMDKFFDEEESGIRRQIPSVEIKRKFSIELKCIML